jgi:hypothetical protein
MRSSDVMCLCLNPLVLRSTGIYLKTQSAPRSKHTVLVTKTSHLMLYRETIAVYTQIHTEYIDTLYGLNVEFVNVKLAVRITTGLGVIYKKYIYVQSVPRSKNTPSRL